MSPIPGFGAVRGELEVCYRRGKSVIFFPLEHVEILWWIQTIIRLQCYSLFPDLTVFDMNTDVAVLSEPANVVRKKSCR